MKNVGLLLDAATNDFDLSVVKDSFGMIIQGLQTGDVTKQNVAIILHMHPGELKEQPTVGVGISNMILDKDYLLYKHKIRQQLDAEGMAVKRLEINGQNIEINASYK